MITNYFGQDCGQSDEIVVRSRAVRLFNTKTNGRSKRRKTMVTMMRLDMLSVTHVFVSN